MSARRFAGAGPQRPYEPPVPSKLLSRRSQAYYGNINRWSIIEEDRARQRAEDAAQARSEADAAEDAAYGLGSARSGPLLKHQRLPLVLVSASSEMDAASGARTLESSNPRGRGWLSARFCDGPQILGFHVATPPPPASSASREYSPEEVAADMVTVTSLQLLAHEVCIPKSVEVFVGRVPSSPYESDGRRKRPVDNKGNDVGNDVGIDRGNNVGPNLSGLTPAELADVFNSCQFTFVGACRFSPRTPMQTRELQTLSGLAVKDCRFLLLRFSGGAHPHPGNLFKQVGLVALNVTGTSAAYAAHLEKTTGYTKSRKALLGFHGPDPPPLGRLRPQPPLGASPPNGGAAFSPRFARELDMTMSRIGFQDDVHRREFRNYANAQRRASVDDLAFEMRFDQFTCELLKHLNAAKQHLVLIEDFEGADHVKDAEDRIRDGGTGLRLTTLFQRQVDVTRSGIEAEGGEEELKAIADLGAQLRFERRVCVRDLLLVEELRDYLEVIAPRSGRAVWGSVGCPEGPDALLKMVKEEEEARAEADQKAREKEERKQKQKTREARKEKLKAEREKQKSAPEPAEVQEGEI